MKTNLIALLTVATLAILGQTLSAQVPPGSLSNGLVAYYPLDGNANDSSGNGLNGVLYDVSPTADRFGRLQRAMTFKGSSGSYVDLGAPTSLKFNADFTVTAWARFSGGTGNPRIVSYGADCGYELLAVDGQHFGVNLACVKFGADPAFPEDMWHFVAARRSGSSATIFIDGKLVATNTVSALQSFTGNLNLGRKSIIDAAETRTYWGGAIDEVRFYNRALSEAELDKLYSEPQSPGLGSAVVAAPLGLIGWWPGDGNAKDIAGTNHGILVNASTRPGYIGGAFAFSGQNSYVQIPNSPAINSITNALTLEAWVWHDATGATIQRYITLTPDKAQIGYNNGSLKVDLHFQDGAGVPLTSDMSIETRKWYHVAGTYDGSELRLYINGVRVSVAVINRPTGWQPGSEADISIAGQAMNGLIDEAAIYNRALTAEEIQSHFLAGNTGMAKAPVFSAIGLSFPGNARLSIKGQAGKAVTIQSSTNLVDWVPLTTDPNLTGTIDFTDSSAGGFSRRFYRAVAK